VLLSVQLLLFSHATAQNACADHWNRMAVWVYTGHK